MEDLHRLGVERRVPDLRHEVIVERDAEDLVRHIPCTLLCQVVIRFCIQLVSADGRRCEYHELVRVERIWNGTNSGGEFNVLPLDRRAVF